MSKVYVFLADGFEEIEGLTVVDLLRRAKIPTTTVSIKETKDITGAHNIEVKADQIYQESRFTDADMLVLPGGGLGTENLESFQPLRDLLEESARKGIWIGAICAAPRILAGLGLLKNRKATSYPSVMEMLEGAQKVTDSVVVDGNIITSRGLGTAIDFSLALIRLLKGPEKAEEISQSVVYGK